MKLQTILKSSGMTEKQAIVYLSCLELGSASVQAITKKCHLPRTTVYDVLDFLIEAGLVSHFLKKKIKYYNAEDPDQIIRLLESRVATLKDALPELNAIVGRAQKRPTVRFYQGKEEMKLILEEILDEADRLWAFGSSEDLFRELDYFPKFVQKRLQKKIPLQVILKDSPNARERQRLGQQHLRQVKLISDISDFNGMTWIWKNKITMFSLAGDFSAVVIESKELAEMQKAWFDCLWNMIVK